MSAMSQQFEDSSLVLNFGHRDRWKLIEEKLLLFHQNTIYGSQGYSIANCDLNICARHNQTIQIFICYYSLHYFIDRVVSYNGLLCPNQKSHLLARLRQSCMLQASFSHVLYQHKQNKFDFQPFIRIINS